MSTRRGTFGAAKGSGNTISVQGLTWQDLAFIRETAVLAGDVAISRAVPTLPAAAAADLEGTALATDNVETGVSRPAARRGKNLSHAVAKGAEFSLCPAQAPNAMRQRR